MASQLSTFGPRGRKLWRDLHARATARDPATDTLIEEACRIADRLEKLDEMIRSKSGEWVTFKVNDDYGDVEITVVIDNLLQEARQQATALRGLLGPLCKASDVVPTKREVSAADDIAARRAARLAQATAT